MGTPGNPMLMQALQGLRERLQGGGGAPPGGPPGGGMPGMEAAQQTGQTPFGQEYEELERLKGAVSTLVPRLLTRIPKEAPNLAKCIATIERAQKALREAPQQPVAAPPPGLPMMGGPALSIPPGEPPPAFM